MLRKNPRIRPSIRGMMFVAAMVSAGSLVGSFGWTQDPQPTEPAKKLQRLLNVKELRESWQYYSAVKDAKLEETWVLEKTDDGKANLLKCLGKPDGYLRTKATDYDNFQLRLEWKYPKDENGNSGILIFTTGEDKIWPKAIQVQLHTPTAGSVFPVGDAMSANKLDKKNIKLPVNKWHTCVVTCEKGTIAVEINGKKLGTVTGCKPQKGSIALQSEGSEIHFRNITLRHLKPAS